MYLKAYPPQAVPGQLSGIGAPRANYWLHHPLPLLRSAPDGLGVLPERDGAQPGKRPARSGRLLIDGTERRRQRPEGPEKQARHYSGKEKAQLKGHRAVVRALAFAPGAGILASAARAVTLPRSSTTARLDKRLRAAPLVEAPPA